jgi:RimJ/RimL family protein N-acetyltransferase
MIEYRILTAEDSGAYKPVRYRALMEEKNAFSFPPDVFARMSDLEVQQRLTPDEDHYLVGAWTDEGALVAQAGLFRDAQPKLRNKASIFGTYVAPEWRGQGIARGLMTYLLSQVHRIPDLRQVQLCVVETQIPAKTLYESLGFVVFGLEKEALNVDGRYLDEYHMQLFLTRST